MKVHQVSKSVHVVTGTNVNWALVAEGEALTVIDAGYPNDGQALLDSIAAIGHRVEDVEAVLLTHAHLDHMGGVPTLLRAHEVPVLTGSVEAAHAHRDHLEQISPAQMLRQCTTKRGLVWVGQTLRAVLPHATMSVPQARPVEGDIGLDLPGAPVPVATPGHTSGHTAYLLPDAGVVFSGDALVTAHPLLMGPPRPQFLPDFFSEDEVEMRRSLSVLAELPADTIVPGHGPTERRPISEVAAAIQDSLSPLT